jgi:mRNA interferase RelE/StbE
MTEADSSVAIERVAPSAEKYMRRLPRKEKEAVAEIFEYLCRSPFRHPNPTVIKPLKGQYKGLWRYRKGQLRIIYEVNKEQRAVYIIAIAHRGSAY